MTTFIHSIRWIIFSSIIKRLLLFITYFFFIQFVDAKELGHYNEFSTILVTLLIINFLSFDFLYIAEKKEKANASVFLQTGFFISTLASLLFFLFHNQIASIYQSTSLSIVFKYAPFIIFIEFLRRSLRVVLQREGKFNVLAIGEILNTILYCSLFCIVLPFHSSTPILIILYYLGNVAEMIFLWHNNKLFTTQVKAIFNIKNVHISLKKMKQEKHFVFFTTTTHLFGQLGDSAPILLLGHFLTSASTGIYALANQLITLPVQMVLAPIERVFFTHLADCTNEEMEEKITKYTIFCMGFLWISWIFIVSILRILVPIILPEKWISTLSILIPIASIQAFRLLVTPLSSIPIIKKKTNIELYYKLFSFAIRILAVWTFAKYGLRYAIYSFGVAQIISYFVLFYILLKMININIIPFLKKIASYSIASIVLFILYYIFENFSVMVLQIAAYFITYISIFLLNNNRSNNQIFLTIKETLKR